MFAGNPCVLQVGALRVGVTNGDVLKELMSNSYRKWERMAWAER